MSFDDTSLSDVITVPPTDGADTEQPNIQNGHVLDGLVNKDNVDLIDVLNVDFSAVQEHVATITDTNVSLESIAREGRVGKLAKNALESVLGPLILPNGTPIATTETPSGVNLSAVVEASQGLIQKAINDAENVITAISEKAKAAASFTGEAEVKFAQLNVNYLAKQGEALETMSVTSPMDMVLEIFPFMTNALYTSVGRICTFDDAENPSAIESILGRLSRLSLSGSGQDAWIGLINNCQPLKMGDNIVDPQTLQVFDTFVYEERPSYKQLLQCIGGANHAKRVNVCLTAISSALRVVSEIQLQKKENENLTLVDLQAGIDVMRHCICVIAEARAQYMRLLELFDYGIEIIDVCYAARSNTQALFAATETEQSRRAKSKAVFLK